MGLRSSERRIFTNWTIYRASTSIYSLTFRVRHFRRYAVMCTDCQYALRYVVIATKPMHRLQIRPNSHCTTRGTLCHSPSYIRVRALVWECGRGQTHRHTDSQIDTQTRVTNIHFASSTTHAKCNEQRQHHELQPNFTIIVNMFICYGRRMKYGRPLYFCPVVSIFLLLSYFFFFLA